MKKLMGVMLCLMLVASSLSSVQARVWPRKQTIPKGLPKNGEFVTAIGDSVMMGAQNNLHKLYPKMVIDTQVSRQCEAALKVFKELKAKKAIGNYVIIALGTNGHLHEKTINKILKYLGNRQIYWVTNYVRGLTYAKNNSKLIARLSKTHKNLTAIRWDQYVVKHRYCLGGDGCHLTGKGTVAFAHQFDPYISYVNKKVNVDQYLNDKNPKAFAKKFYLNKWESKTFDYAYSSKYLTMKRLIGMKTNTDFYNRGAKYIRLWKMAIGESRKETAKHLSKAYFRKEKLVKKDDHTYLYKNEGTLTLQFKKGKLASYKWKLRPATEENAA